MKPITIRNKEYYYKVVSGWTQFYKGKEDTSFIFYGTFDIEDPKFSKLEMKIMIDEMMRIYDRKLEIERGEII
jgi:hypothetical protein